MNIGDEMKQLDLTKDSKLRIPTDKEFKEVLINMLSYFNKYCKKNNIKFFLMYGSLLGAARHKGIIPWDDDIDLVIPRPDYTKLIKKFNNESERYKIVSTETYPEYTAPLAKIIDTKTILRQHYGYKEKVELGIYIDLFVYDGLPDDEIERKNHVKKALDLANKWGHANHEFYYKGDSFFKNLARWIWYAPTNILGYKHMLKVISKNALKYDYENSNYIGNLLYVVTPREVYPKSYFETDYLEFEKMKCPVPKEYEKILTQHYGDWKKLPPEEKRVTHHDYDCYIIED